MKKILLLCSLALAAFSSCKKDDLFDKFVPEVLFYENDRVENADFVSTTLTGGDSEWTVKARVSAPMKLKEIKLYSNDALLETYTDFQLAPNVYNLNYELSGISQQTIVRVDAVDADNKRTSRTFTINVTP